LDRRLLVSQGQCGHEGITFTLFMVYLLVLVVANIIINDTLANSELYMVCTSYPSIILEGMWESIKITGKPVSGMRFECGSSAIQSRNTAHFTTALIELDMI
jgi:hypothetical protein